MHCLQGLDFALKYKWYDPSTFNQASYNEMKRYENGDLNWIIPGKFLALKTPNDHEEKGCCSSAESKYHNSEFYIPIFQRLGIKHVIRLNNSEYDREKFLNSGINHTDLYFADGNSPPEVN